MPHAESARRRFSADDGCSAAAAMERHCTEMTRRLSEPDVCCPGLDRERTHFEKRARLYKTEICRAYEETGHCRYGDRCQFAHSTAELRPTPRHPRYKTEICRTFWEQGTCPYGKRCCFIHDESHGRSSRDLLDKECLHPISLESSYFFESSEASLSASNCPLPFAIPSGCEKTQPPLFDAFPPWAPRDEQQPYDPVAMGILAFLDD